MATRQTRRSSGEVGAGLGVDASGGPVVDPTENVLALVDVEKQHQSAMLVEIGKRYDAEITHLKDIGAMRAAHATEIRQMETERLDSIRQVDVLARNTAADRAADAIQALAATTATNAENLRTALANTAATIAKQTADAQMSTAKVVSDQFEAVTKRIATLEATAYRGEGREKFADPERDRMQAIVSELALSAKAGTAKSEGFNAAWAVVAIIATLFLSVAGTVITFVVMNRSASPPIVYSQPPVTAPVR
jgi:hypothetical protein